MNPAKKNTNKSSIKDVARYKHTTKTLARDIEEITEEEEQAAIELARTIWIIYLLIESKKTPKPRVELKLTYVTKD